MIAAVALEHDAGDGQPILVQGEIAATARIAPPPLAQGALLWSVAFKVKFNARKIDSFRGSAVILRGIGPLELFHPRIGQRKAPKLGLASLPNAGLLPFGLTPECLLTKPDIATDRSC